MPIDTEGRDSALVNLTDAAPTTGRLYEGPGRANLSPRAGLAWDVFGDGSTSVRGGYGLYFGTHGAAEPDRHGHQSAGDAALRDRQPDVPDAAVRARRRQHDPADAVGPRRARGCTCGTSARSARCRATSSPRVGYAGSRGTHLYRNTDVNIPAPATGADGRPFFAAGLPRPNRSFGTIELKSSDGDSWYRALIVELRRTWQDGLSLQSSYTWSRTEDTTQASTFFSDSTNGTTVAFPEVDPGLQQGAGRLGHAAQPGGQRDVGHSVRARPDRRVARAARRLAGLGDRRRCAAASR